MVATIREELVRAGSYPERQIVCTVSQYRSDCPNTMETLETFSVPLHELAMLDTITWRGWYCSLSALAKIVQRRYPYREVYCGFERDQQVSGIRKHD